MSRRAPILGRSLLALVCSLGMALVGCASKDLVYDNVVLVTIDTLRADHLGCYGYPRPTSPFLDALAAESVMFDNAYSASSHTAPSHTSIFTSLYPEQHQVLINGVTMTEGLPSMAGLLRERGLQTAAFVSVGFLASLNRGFDVFDSEMPQVARFRTADKTVDRALSWLEGRDPFRPVFLWVHLYDPHEHGPGEHVPEGPLELMAADAARREAELLSFLERSHGLASARLYGDLGRYDAQIRFTDRQLERLFVSVRARPLEGATLWVITSDHGEALGEHGYIGHGRFLYNEQLHVPLLMYGQGRRNRPARITPQVRLVDLLPTVMELTGEALDSESPSIEGRSLAAVFEQGQAPPTELSLAQRRPVDERRRKLGWIDGDVVSAQGPRYKYILNTGAEDEFYDLLADPHEVRNLIGVDNAVKDELGAWVRQKLQALRRDKRPGSLAPQQIDERYIESLKALGYM